MNGQTSGTFFIVTGIMFIAAGLFQQHTVFIGGGATFFVIGAGLAAKGRRERGPKE